MERLADFMAGNPYPGHNDKVSSLSQGHHQSSTSNPHPHASELSELSEDEELQAALKASLCDDISAGVPIPINLTGSSDSSGSSGAVGVRVKESTKTQKEIKETKEIEEVGGTSNNDGASVPILLPSYSSLSTVRTVAEGGSSAGRAGFLLAAILEEEEEVQDLQSKSIPITIDIDTTETAETAAGNSNDNNGVIKIKVQGKLKVFKVRVQLPDGSRQSLEMEQPSEGDGSPLTVRALLHQIGLLLTKDKDKDKDKEKDKDKDKDKDKKIRIDVVYSHPSKKLTIELANPGTNGSRSGGCGEGVALGAVGLCSGDMLRVIYCD